MAQAYNIKIRSYFLLVILSLVFLLIQLVIFKSDSLFGIILMSTVMEPKSIIKKNNSRTENLERYGSDVNLQADMEPNPFFRKWRNMGSEVCKIPDLKFILTSQKACKRSGDINLLILINSKANHFKHRKAIRETWANSRDLDKYSTDYVFLMGLTYNTDDMLTIQHESVTYSDIVLGNFVDTYANLSLKTLTGLKWAATRCPEAKTVFKTDDDMWLNLHVINKTLELKAMKDLAIYGNCFGSGYPHRSPTSKWYTPYRFYPYRWYSSFCLGSALIMKNTTVQQLWNSSQNVPFFHIEDVFISSLLSGNAGVARLATSTISVNKALSTKDKYCGLSKAVLLDDNIKMYKAWMKQNRCY